MKYSRIWEEIDHETARLKVFGGWIIHAIETRTGEISTSMVFVPDPEFKWVLNEEA